MINAALFTPRRKKTAIILSGAVLFYILFGFLAAPFIVRTILEKKVAAAIHRTVTVGQVRVNPLTLSLTLRNLHVRERGGAPFVKLDEAYANLQASSMFKWALVIKSVRLVNPEIDVVRTGEATFNFSDIGGDRTAAGAPSDGGGLALVIIDINIAGGRIGVDDRVAAVNHRIEDLKLGVADFSSRPADANVETRVNLSARINDAPFTLNATARPFSPERQTRARIGLQACQVTHYLPYATLPENLIIQSFTLQTDNEIDFQVLTDGKPELVVAGRTELIDVRVTDGQKEPFVHHPNMKLDLLPSKVLSGQLRFGKVETDEPEYFLKRLPSGEFYMPFLAAAAYRKAEEKSQADATGDFRPVVTVDNLNLTRGIVHLTDLSNRTPFVTTVTRLDLEVNNFGLNSDRTAEYRLQIKTEADESAAVSGIVALEPLQASGTIDVSDVKVPRYQPYTADRFGFKIADGRVSLGGNFRFRQEEKQPLIALSGVSLNVDALKVVEEADDAPLISLDQLRVGDAAADLNRGEVTLGSLQMSRAHLVCLREKDGSLNLERALRHRSQADPSDNTGGAAGHPAPSEAPRPAPVVVTLKSVSVSDALVDVEDRVPGDPVRLRLDAITLNAADLSTAPGSTGRADLALRWEQAGQLQIGGEVSIAPLSLNLAVKMKQMDIRPFQPYLSEQAGLIVTQGFFNTQGRLQMKQTQAAGPSITYRGKAGVNRFASIDRKNANDFLKWQDLLLDDVAVEVNPTRLSVEQISLADFFARVIIDPDGSVNLVTMFNPPDGAGATVAGTSDSAETAPKAPPTPVPATGKGKPVVRIARVNLSKGIVDFSDRLIKPNFNARFHDLGGHVTGLESIAEKRADVLLEGVWSNQAPVKITGQINPLIENPYVDLNLNISDIELSPFSPYSGKYIGYILEKGKLTFNVAYLMENQKLEGKNSIYINQLTLGDTVESPDAVNLPIKLAVALLKDREGNIELDLPVSGSLDDPQFKIGKVILTVLKNLIVKIVTSPFAALGVLAGGGEELSYLEFDAGVGGITPENAEKMDKLAKILYERPALKLDVQGTASPERDGEALRSILLENRLKAQKLQQMMKAGKSAVPLEEISLTEEERPALLQTLFAADRIAVPVDGSGKPVELTPQLMEHLLRERTVVTDNDYRSLATTRAFDAKDYLLGTGQVERERVFIVEPRISAGDQQQAEIAAGSVVFSLK